MSADDMIIAFAGDQNCVPGIGYALRSLAKSNPHRAVRVYLSDSSDRDCAHLRAQFSGDLTVLNSADVVSDPDLWSFINAHRYFQILVPYLDEAVTAPVLYLDHDVLVLQSLDRLANQGLQGKTAAMAADFVIAARPGTQAERNRRLGRAEHLTYFNSGVLLADPIAFRAKHYAQASKDYYLTDPARSICPDQCALNAVLGEDCGELAIGYNWQTMGQRYFPKTAPTIVHFTGNWKPWRRTSYFHSAEVKRLCELSTTFWAKAGGPEMTLADRCGQWLSWPVLKHLPSHAKKRRALAQRFGLGSQQSPNAVDDILNR